MKHTNEQLNDLGDEEWLKAIDQLIEAMLKQGQNHATASSSQQAA